MEITGLQCNGCGKKAFPDDSQFNLWATILVTVDAMRLEQRIHYCPMCFTEWNGSLRVGPVQVYDPDLARLLKEEEEIERRAQDKPPVSPPTGNTVFDDTKPIPPPPPLSPPEGPPNGPNGKPKATRGRAKHAQ